jgi:uncharacterized membrane protein YeiH
LFAAAAAAGAGTLILLIMFGVSIPIAGIVCIIVTTMIRLGAVRFNWRFPEQRPLPRPTWRLLSRNA